MHLNRERERVCYVLQFRILVHNSNIARKENSKLFYFAGSLAKLGLHTIIFGLFW